MAEFQSIFTGQEVDNTINKLRSWIAVDGSYPTVTISGVTYAVIWKIVPTAGTACYGIGLHPTTGRPYEIYYNGSSYSATALDANTDTKNTAGSTSSTSKLFLVGAGSQAASAQTYSNANIYMTDGTLYLVKTTDLSGTANNKPALIVGGADTSTHLELDCNEIHAKATGTTTAPLYLNNDGGNTYLSGSKTYSDGTYLYSNSTKVLTGHQTIYNLGLKFNDETSAALTFDPNGAASTWTIKPSTTKGAFTVGDGTTTKTIQLAGAFTDSDTKNTAGSTNSTSKLFLIGATSQAANPQTYSHQKVYETDGTLNATKYTISETATIQYNSSSGCIEIIC